LNNIELQPAYVLLDKPYGETSAFIECFTRDRGRIGVIAKGVKRPKNPKRGLLRPFVPLLISCVGRGELWTLRDVDVESRHLRLVGRQLIFGFYLNELFIRLLQRSDPHPELFFLYRETLLKFEQGDVGQRTLRLFEKSLLKGLGYELQLTLEMESGSPVEPDKFYTFDPEEGPYLIKQPDRMTYTEKMPAWGINQISVYRGKSLLALSAETLLDAEELRDAKRLMRSALANHLGPRPLESRRLLSI